MIIECENCGTKFRLDPAKLDPNGSKVRCAKCKRVFLAKPPNSETGSQSSSAPPKNVEGQPPDTIPKPEDSPSESSNGQEQKLAVESELLSQIPKPDSPQAPVTKEPQEFADDPFAEFMEVDSEFGEPQGNERNLKLDNLIANDQKETSAPKAIRDHPQQTSKPKFSPPKLVLTSPVSKGQKALRALTVVVVLIVGILLGMLAIGLDLDPQKLKVALTYRINITATDRLTVLEQNSRIIRDPAFKRTFVATGKIFNPGNQGRKMPGLRLEVFSPGGEFITQASLDCCSKTIEPHSTESFEIRADLPNQEVGKFRIQLQNEK